MNPHEILTPAEIDRFTTKLVRVPSGCLEFTGQRNNHGYGRFEVTRGRIRRGRGGKSRRLRILAHRLAYALTAPLADDQKLLHSCDNPPCCDPTHLTPGTQTQNMRDAAARGRADISGLLDHLAERRQWPLDRVARGRKRCPACETEKNLDDFHRNAAAPDGRQAYCRPCRSTANVGQVAS